MRKINYYLERKRKVLFISVGIVAFLTSSNVYSQEQEQTQDNTAIEDMSYRRSSLTMLLLQGGEIKKDGYVEDNPIDNSPEGIRRIWDSYPFPELYDKHTIENGNISVKSSLSYADIFEARKGKKQKEDAIKTLPLIQEQLKTNKIANKVVKAWFSSEDGSTFWNMGTIQKRGFYNASDLDVKSAQSDVRGLSKLSDAGEELINNSFVTVTDILVYENKPVAEFYRKLAATFKEAAKKASSEGGGSPLASIIKGSVAAGSLATAAGLEIAAKVIEDGYTVVSKTYLFKLKWNEEVSANFYQIWENNEAFNNMDFELEYIGVQLDETVLNRSTLGKSPEIMIKQSVVRNIDHTFTLLQQENDVFKPKVLITKADPIQAKIGMKESLEGGEKFAVLQKIQDPVTGAIKYKTVGSVKVDKKQIWDNRYSLADEGEREQNENEIKATYFVGGKNFTPGMLLKQVSVNKKKKQ